jgi:uncharacterized protein YkwD
MLRIAKLFLLILCISLPLTSGAVAYLRLDQGIVEKRLELSPADAQARLRLLRDQFREAGCEPKYMREQPMEGEALPNLICTLPGSAKGTIVFAAPLEFSGEGGDGSGWATLAMLPLLIESLNGTSHQCSLVFIAFANHSGVSTYLAQLPDASRKSIVAMIDLQQLGWNATYAFPGPPEKEDKRVGRLTIEVPATHEDTPLSQLLLAAANTLKIPRPESSSDAPPNNLASAFQQASISSLIVTSPNYVTLKRFDGSVVRVQQSKLDLKAYYQTYNLLCVFGLHLDQAFGPDRTKAVDHSETESQLVDHLLKVINAMRANAALAPLAPEARVTGDATQQAAAFASNKRLDNELKIEERLAKLGVMFTDASEVWFVLPEEAAKDDELIRESIGNDARQSLLDPRFTVAGVAAAHRGKSYFVVATLISPMRELSPEGAEAALLTSIQQARKKLNLPELQVATSSATLRELACSMAKQDSLQAGVDAARAPKVFAFTSSNPERSEWVDQIASFSATKGTLVEIKFNRVTVGICRASSATAPNEAFWVLVQLSQIQ